MKYFTTIIFFLAWLNYSAQSPNWQWAVSEGAASSDNASGISTDNLGNSYVCGYYYSSTLSIGTTSLVNNGNYDFYIAKYNNAGIAQWAKSFGGAYDDNALAIAHDISGNCFVTGYFISPTMVVDTYTLTNSGAGDIFVVKLDVNGNVVWAKNYGDGGSNQGNSITTDVSGNIFVTGYFNNTTLTLDTYTLTGNGNDDVFVLKCNSSGNIQWASNFGDNLSDVGNGIATDLSGNVFVTGYFKSGTMSVGSTTLVNVAVTSADLFLIKLDNAGSIINATSVGDAFDEVGYGITADNSGNIAIAGYFFSPTLTVGTSTLSNYGTRDALIIKCDNNCNFLWAKEGGGSFDDYAYGIDADASGNIYVNGHVHSFLGNFGTYTLSAAGIGDGFLVKYDINGNVLWADIYGGTNDDGWNALSTDGAGNVYCVGYFTNTSIMVGTINLTTVGAADILIAKLNTSNFVNEAITEIGNDVVVYPNPSNGKFNIVSKDGVSIEIIDLSGKIIYNKNNLKSHEVIDFSNAAKGFYVVRIIEANAITTKKLVLN